MGNTEDEKIKTEIEVKETVTVEEGETKKTKAKKALKKLHDYEKGVVNDFKKFISKGNIVQLAVAFILGGAFAKIVSSLVGDIFMPLLGLIAGANDITLLKWHVSGNVVLYYGRFISALIDFFFIALVLFLIIRAVSRAQSGAKKLKKLHKSVDAPAEEPAPEPAPELTTSEKLLTEIKELLANKDNDKKNN